MAIPAFFKVVSDVSKAKSVAEGNIDVTSIATKGITKFNPDKRIDTNNTEPMKDSTQKFNPDKRIESKSDELPKIGEQQCFPNNERQMSYDEISEEQIRAAFKTIFYKLGQSQHYDMMVQRCS